MARYNTKHRKRIALLLLVLIGLLLFAGSNWLGRLFYPLPYGDIVAREAAVYHLDPLLVAAIIKAESNFRSDAVSIKGARGLMQIMPDTGQWIASQIGVDNYRVEMLTQPAINIKFGCWYIANLYKEFNGDQVIVLAAYNGGRGNVRQWIAAKRWPGTQASLEQIPYGETKDYVARVLINHKRYRNLYQ
jgi:soluble lytic murein transglycosylase